MLDWLVCDGKLSKIVAYHFRLCVCLCTENGDGEKGDIKEGKKGRRGISCVPLEPTLISTWLKTFPLWMPTTLPIISGTTIMFLKWVLTTAGFSIGGASFLAFLRRLMSASGFRFRPTGIARSLNSEHS